MLANLRPDLGLFAVGEKVPDWRPDPEVALEMHLLSSALVNLVARPVLASFRLRTAESRLAAGMARVESVLASLTFPALRAHGATLDGDTYVQSVRAALDAIETVIDGLDLGPSELSSLSGCVQMSRDQVRRSEELHARRGPLTSISGEVERALTTTLQLRWPTEVLFATALLGAVHAVPVASPKVFRAVCESAEDVARVQHAAFMAFAEVVDPRTSRQRPVRASAFQPPAEPHWIREARELSRELAHRNIELRA